MKDQDLIIIEKKKKKIQVVFALVLSLIVVLFIGKSLADLLENGSEVTPNTQLTYYLDVSYDGIDKNGIQSGDTVVSEVRSGLLYVEDKLPEGLIFNGFVTTSDGTIGAVKRDDSTVLCTGGVIDDTHDASTSTGTWNSGNTEYTYHGLHYDAATRTVHFQVEKLQAGCKLTVGIITTTPPIDDPNTVEEEVRRDFYNFATSREKDLIVNSNTVHSFMKKSSSTISSFYNVSYQYTGTVPSNAPSVPATTAYVEGAKVGVASSVQLDGYTFSGWSSSTTGVNVSNGSFSMPGRDVVFTGSFTANPTYNVTYSLTGTTPNGYTLPLQKSYYPNSVVDVDNLKVGDVIGGYRFLGWTPTTSGVVVDSNGQFIMPNSAVSFTGSFELVTYSVSYEFYDTVLPPNSDNYLPSSQTYSPGDTVSLSTVNAIPNGYDFLGWYHDDYFTMPSQNVVIYGEWRRSQQSGTFTPTIVKEFIDTDDYYHYGDTVQFRITVTNTASFPINNVLIRDLADGAYFSTGSGYTVVSSSIVNINTINANGSFSLFVNYPVKKSDIGTVTNTVELVSASPDSNHSGYTLTEGDYTASDTFTAIGPNTVTYHFMGNLPDGYVIPADFDAYQGDTISAGSLTAGDIVNGYRFLGWSSTDVVISNGEFVMPNNNVTIIGEFEEITYTLTYQFDNSVLPPNSALYLPANQGYSAGSQVSLETINSPNGYEFMGWSSNDVTITNNEFIMPGANVTVTGTWREVGTFEPTITKTIVDPQSYYKVGDTVNFTITLTNNERFAIENVVLEEFLTGAEFVSGSGYSLVNDTAVITSIGANSSATVNARYTITSGDSGSVINTVKMTSASADSNHSGFSLLDREYAASASIPLQPSITICKQVSGVNTGNVFQFHVEESNHLFDTWIVLHKDECGSIEVEPGTYTVLEVVPQEYMIQSITGLNSNGSNLVVQAGGNYSITYINEFRRKNFLHSTGRVENTIDNVTGINSYTVVFHSNGGNGADVEQDIEFEQSENLRLNTFTHNSLNFAYWTTKPDGTGTIYQDGELVTDLGDSSNTTIDLYAHWVSGVAMIGNTVYTTLSAAVAAVNSDSTATASTPRTIKLLANALDSVTVNSGKNIIFDLRGYTVHNSAGTPIITNNGTAIIKNGTIDYSVTFTDAIESTINNNGTLTVDGAHILMTRSGGKQAIYNNNGGTLTIKGDSTFHSISTNRTTVHNKNGTINIESGTITSDSFSAVVNDSGTLRIGISDGVISSSTPVIQGGIPSVSTVKFYGVDNSSSATTLFYDGIIKGVTGAIKTESVVTKENDTAIFHENQVIDGQTYDCATLQEKVVITFNPNGGTVSEASRDIGKGSTIGTLPTPTYANYLFDGWFTEETGGTEVLATTTFDTSDEIFAHWTPVASAVYVRNVTTGVGYNTLAAAITAAGSGDLLRLERDISGSNSFTIPSGKNIILDAASKTLSTTSGNLIVNSGTLTIIGGTLSSTAQAGVINNENGGVLTITGGTINAYNRAAVYNLSGGTVNISGGTFTSIATGAVSNMNRATLQNLAGGTMTVTGGEVINTANGPGVSNKGSVTFGVEDGNISTTSPLIRGNTYGVYNYSGCTFNFYDGIMMGGTGSGKGPYYGTETDKEDGTTFANGSEVIDGTTYSTAYLN